VGTARCISSRGTRAWATSIVVSLAFATVYIASPAYAAAGVITTVAGTGVAGYSGDGGPATAAQLSFPVGVDIDASGNLYVTEWGNDRVRKVTPAGIISTVAGSGTEGFSGDGGPATAAQLSSPADVAVDGAGNLFIADFGNNRIRKVDTSGNITTVAGTGAAAFGGDGGPATAADIYSPAGIDVDFFGNLLIADSGNNRIRRVSPSGTIITVAGVQQPGYTGNGGPATSARMRSPVDVVADASGNIFIAEYGNDVVRRVDTSGIITTVAGTGAPGYSGDSGPATAAAMSSPAGVEVDSTGRIFIADFGNHVIREVDVGGTISTVAGTGQPGYTGDGGLATSARLNFPARVKLDSNGDFYLADTSNNVVRKVEILGNPAAPSFTGTTPPSPSPNNSPAITGTAAAGSTVRLYTNSSCTSAVAATGTASSFASPGLTVTVGDDSTTTFYGTVTDTFGNTSGCSIESITYVEDSTGPLTAPTLTSTPGAAGTDPSPTWTFTTEPGTTTRCRLERGGIVVFAESVCPGMETYDLSTEPDGVYTFSVWSVDAAGNTGPNTTSTYELDTAAPGAPVLTATPGAMGTDTTPTWAFTSEAGTTTDCRLERDGVVVSGYAACSGSRTYSLSTDGTYTFSVQATDQVGNVGPETTSTYILDMTPPAAPVLTATPGASGTDTSPTWDFTAESGATTECRLEKDGVVFDAYSSCADSRTYTLSADGSYRFSVRATDQVGNVGPKTTSTYVLDTTAPGAPTITSAPAAQDNDPTPTWSFTAEAGAQTECSLRQGGTVVEPFASCTDSKTYTLSSDGAFTFLVRATDSTGNTGPEATSDYELDTTAPAAPTVTGGPSTPSNDSTPTWTFTVESGASAQCSLWRGGTVIDPFSPCADIQTYDLTTAVDGTYQFRVRATDQVGNVSVTTLSSYVLDTTPPAAPTFTDTPGAQGNDPTPMWSFNVESGAVAECRLEKDGVEFSAYSPCSGSQGYDLSEDGAYRFSVRAVDAAGNVGAVSRSTYELDTTAPNEPIITAAPGVSGADNTPTWAFTTDAGTTTACRLDRGGVTEFSYASCIDSKTYDLSIAGSYTFFVRATDQAGNVSTAATSTYVLALVTPPPPPEPEPEPEPDPDPDPDIDIIVPGPVPSDPPVADVPSETEASETTGDRQRPEFLFDRPVAGPSAAESVSGTEDDARSTSERTATQREPLTRLASVGLGIVKEPIFPGFLIVIVIMFLFIQNRIDRNDPKLALAPVYATPDLGFRSLGSTGEIDERVSS
jgi:NHL repeat